MSSDHRDSQQDGHSPPNSHVNNEHEPDVHGDLDLANAIGDAFKEFAMLESEARNNADRELYETEHDQASREPEVDLESVVGDVFSNFNEHQFNQNADHGDPGYDYRKPESEMAANQDTANTEQHEFQQQQENQEQENHVSPVKQEDEEPTSAAVPEYGSAEAETHEPHDDEQAKSDEDHDLETAIGDVFKNLAADMQMTEQSTEHEQTEIPQATEGTNGNSGHQTPTQRSDDENLEDAIGDAFKSLEQNSLEAHDVPTQRAEEPEAASYDHSQEAGEDHNDESLQAAISASLHEILESGDHKVGQALLNRRESEAGLDLVGIVQNAVQNITGGSDSKHDKLSLSKDVISGLASEITNQVQSHETGQRPKDIPTLDENVLAHFQSKANKDDGQDATLRAAVASAVSQALPAANETQQGQEKEPDLEKLQMNEILQNAFNMAMQNPQELLTSLDMDEDAEKATAGQEQGTALSTAAAIAALSAGALGKKPDAEEPLPDKSDSASAKPLSIAETLALHRATMANVAKRDYSSIQSLEDSTRPEVANASQLHPQLSNILSSLSQHIQSGTQSQNLMSVIRQMTNALMHNKSKKTNLSANVQELLKEVKGSSEEKKFVTDVLRKSKMFLSHVVPEVAGGRSLAVIDVVLGVLDFKEEGNDDLFQFLPHETDPSLSHLYDSALGTLSNYDSLRLRTALLGVKPDVASNEYKERIRIENRERKKRWREENAERNKDNDLRSRVLKRANDMFGDESSEAKKAWVEEEFSKRREKRIARQRKDEAKPESKLSPFPDMGNDTKLTGSLSQDAKFSKRVTDCFNLIVECGSEEESQAVLNATAASTAVTAMSHANTVGMLDLKVIETALTSTLGSILDSTVRSGSFKKITFLTKQFVPDSTSNDTQTNTPYTDSYAFDYNSGKRLGSKMLSDPKKPKLDDRANYYSKDSETPAGSTSNLWSSVTGLRMPSYRKPSVTGVSETVKAESVVNDYPVAPVKPSSPFISNKIGIEGAASGPPSGGLRKPGSFQRPVFTTPSNKSGSLGFPTLYSTSFRSK